MRFLCNQIDACTYKIEYFSFLIKHLIDRFRKIYCHILMFIYLLLQENMSSNSMWFERSTEIFKADLATFCKWLFSIHI